MGKLVLKMDQRLDLALEERERGMGRGCELVDVVFSLSA